MSKDGGNETKDATSHGKEEDTQSLHKIKTILPLLYIFCSLDNELTKTFAKEI
jgi:hypothetical protein